MLESCAAKVASAIATASICEPIKGYFTFYLDDDPEITAAEQVAIRSSMLQIVRSGMGNDVYVTGNVNQVVFVGTRAVDGNIPNAPVAVANVNEPKSIGGGNSGLSGPGKGILGAFGALSLLLLLFIFIRRSRKDEVADEQSAESVKIDNLEERDLAAFGHYDSGDNFIPHGSLADKDTLALADTMTMAVKTRGSLADKDTLALADTTTMAVETRVLQAPRPKRFDHVKTLSSAPPMNPSIATTGTKPDGDGKPIVFAAGAADMPVLTMSDVPDEVRGEQGLYDRFDGDIIQCLDAIAEDESEDGMIILQEDDLDGDEDSRTY